MKLRSCHSEDFIFLVQKQEIVVLSLFSLNNLYIPNFRPKKERSAYDSADLIFAPTLALTGVSPRTYF